MKFTPSWANDCRILWHAALEKAGPERRDGRLCDQPADGYHDWLAGCPAALWSVPTPGQAFTHLFTVHRAELEDVLPRILAQMDRNGMIWVSWPKKASKVPTDITEDTIREICLPMGLVDVKVCAVSDVWSALKLMIRKELR